MTTEIFTIDNGVLKVDKERLHDLTSVTIPEGVTTIGRHAFAGCSSITSVTIPEGVTTIGDLAFKGCTSLTSVTIPEGVTSIGEGAFYGCSSLESITIPDSVALLVCNSFLTTHEEPEGCYDFV